MARRSTRAPAVIAAGYALAGLTYIAWSDQALEALTSQNHELYRTLQTWKGWGYIIVTAFLLWIVLRFAFREIHRKMQEAQHAERRLRLALDAAGGVVWTAFPSETSFEVTVTGTIADELGLDCRSCMSIDEIRDRIHPDDRDSFDRLHGDDGLTDGARSQVVCRIRSASGAYRWLKIVPETSATEPSRAAAGTTIGVALDVSEQIETTERLQEAIRGGELGVWRLNLETNGVEVNAEWARMLGYDLADLLPLDLHAFHALLHPDDSAALKETHARTIAESRAEFTNELRMKHKDGRWVWVLSRGKATHFSATMDPVVLAGVHIDISARKSLEKELTSERDFLVKLTETSISGILGLDAEGRMCFANAEAERILGASLTDLQRPPAGTAEWDAQFLNGQSVPTGDMPFKKVIELGKPINGMRLTIRRADGSRCAISLNGAPVQAEGSPIRVVFSLTDISDELRGQRALERAAESALHEALHDPLTGLSNREYFSRNLLRMTNEGNEPTSSLMLVFLDVDNFKLANDIRGHLAGDALLVQIANRLSAALPPDAVLSRIGGDEFTILMRLPRGKAPKEALAPLIEAFSTPFMLAGDQVWLTCSMGVSLNPQDAELPEDMMRHADIAMYQAKGRGRSQIQVFSSELRHQIHREAEVSQALRQALEENGFHLVFQPRFLLAPGNDLAGAEILLRSRNPILSSIGPQEFIPIGERNGLIRLIDLHVVRLFGEAVEQFRADFPALGFKFSLNISAESLKCDGFGRSLVDELREAGLSPEIVLIEITETAMMGASYATRQNIATVREAGYEFSIDDFGTGHSSLSRLQELPLEEIKVDRSFIARLGKSDNPSDTVVRAILALARELGLRTVGEGVETRSQAVWLANHGCDMVQGYHFFRPAEADAFLRLLKRRNRLGGSERKIVALRAQ
jgi:diguanylate cyclase (GGDEF)-like protein/PAS domain S-box-containing protein